MSFLRIWHPNWPAANRAEFIRLGVLSLNIYRVKIYTLYIQRSVVWKLPISQRFEPGTVILHQIYEDDGSLNGKRRTRTSFAKTWK